MSFPSVSLSHGFLLVMYPAAGTLGAQLGVGTAATILSAVSATGLIACFATWRERPQRIRSRR